MRQQPKLSFWQMWNVSFGFLGVQFGFALQNGNVSRILQALGADVHHLGFFWLAAPIAGIIIQPIIGGASDRSWIQYLPGRRGRRIPFILAGAIAATIAMFLMPNSEFFTTLMPAMFFGATMLLIMDASFNITMQPFRALVGDMVPKNQRDKGYAIQSFLINTGAVVGSLLPFILTAVGVANEPLPGEKVAPSVTWSFYIGGSALILSVLWTSLRTKEYTPEEYFEYHPIEEKPKEAKKDSFIDLLKNMPKPMIQLALVQFFSWVAFYMMWVYSTPAVAEHVWGATDPQSLEYNEAGNWVGVLFGAYSLFAALFSIVMAQLVEKFGRKTVYAFALVLGGIGLASFPYVTDKYMLIVSMAGVGIAWAAILSMPFAILSEVLPADKMGVYMGIFNFTIAGPQILAGLMGATIANALGAPIWIIFVAGICLLLGALSVGLVKQK
ncbi:MFS transporter [Persicobacter diffluens]|uniref:Sugar transporter n=1 Tax=Persicobacter diffluens TaxID=981 RepID=A0AAN4VX97_9BACT|nr:sugar transporter [Persicobacter diffluens]